MSFHKSLDRLSKDVWVGVTSHHAVRFVYNNLATFYTMLAGFLFFSLATSWVSSVYVGILCGTYTLPLYHFLNSEDAGTLSSTRLLMTGAIIGLVSTDGRFFVWLLGYVMGILVDVVHTQYDLIQEEKSVLATVIHNDDDDSIDEFSESEDDDEIPVLDEKVPTRNEAVVYVPENVPDKVSETTPENIPENVSETTPEDVNDCVVTDVPQ